MTIAGLALGAALLNTAGASPGAPCGAPHARTLAQTETSRVYERPPGEFLPAAYFCARGRLPVRLDVPDDELFNDMVLRRPIALNGRFAAYAVDGAAFEATFTFHVTDVQVTDVVRRRTAVSSGRRAFRQGDFGAEGSVRAIVLTDRGSIAWMGGSRLIALDERGNRKLDRRAVPGSLRLRGHRIFWRTIDGVYRTDTLRGTPHRGDPES